MENILAYNIPLTPFKGEISSRDNSPLEAVRRFWTIGVFFINRNRIITEK